jgi:tetratricopeptide (TPR) repeat protein
VQDALADLEKALALKPGRYEAWAAVADCYDQLRRRPDAIRAYQSAIEGEPDNGAWWYRLGRLQLDDDRATDARNTLARAVLLGEAMDARPGWLADAHRILGESLRLAGDRAGAREHFERYLAVASPNAIDRADVERQLELLGVP